MKTVASIDMSEAPWGTGKPVGVQVPRGATIVCAAAIAGKPRLWLEHQTGEEETEEIELWLVEDAQLVPPVADYKASVWYRLRMFHVFENGRTAHDD